MDDLVSAASSTAFNVPSVDTIILLLIFGAFLLLFLLAEIRNIRKKSEQKRSEQHYREQYVKKVYLTDARLGTIETDFDVRLETMNAENADLPAFGAQKPGTITAEGFQESDVGTVIRSIGLAYDRVQSILDSLAETVRQELMFEGTDRQNLPAVSEITEKITVTEFHFVLNSEPRVMQVLGGAEIDLHTFGLNAIYQIDEERWEYDAENIGA